MIYGFGLLRYRMLARIATLDAGDTSKEPPPQGGCTDRGDGRLLACRSRILLGSIQSEAMKSNHNDVMKPVLAWVLLGASLGVHAVGFDCMKASTHVEKMICADARLSVLDTKLQQAYATALSARDASGKVALIKQQRNWIRYARGVCQDTACLRQVYVDRVAVLASNSSGNENHVSDCMRPTNYKGPSKGCGVVVRFYRNANEYVDLFNNLLEKYRCRKDCSM